MSRLPSSVRPPLASSPAFSQPQPSRHGSSAAAAGGEEDRLSRALQGLELQGAVASAGEDGNKPASSSTSKLALNPFAREFVPGSSPSSSADQGFDTIGDSELVLDRFKTEICHQGTHEALKTGEEYQHVGNALQASEGLPTFFKREQTGCGRVSGTLGPELAGHGVLDSVQSTVAGTPPTGKRGQFVNANYLLNFQYDPIPRLPRRAPPPRRQNRPQPYNKELFLQANFRFLVSDFGDYVLNASDPDRMIQWEDIAAVNVSAPVPVQCPICLECPPLCAQITSCGHIFCFPCILRYLLMGEEDQKGDYVKRCPLCFAMVSCKDLRTVFIDDVHNYQVGDIVDFTLLTRAKGSVIPFEISEPVLGSLPYSEDGQCHHFSKFTLTSDAEQTTNIAIAELSEWAERSEKGGEDLELLPYVCAAIDQLQQRQVSWGEHRILELLSSSPPVRQRIIEQAKAGLTKLPTQGLPELDVTDSFADITKKGVRKRHGADVVDVTAETEAAMAELKDKAGWVYEKAFSDEEDSNKIQNRVYRISQSKGKVFDQSFQKDVLKDSNICANLEDVPSTWENLLEGSEILKDVEGNTDIEKKCLDSKADLDDAVAYNFYQSADGQSLILHPLNMKCLLQYYGSYGKLPLRLGAKILEMEMITQTDATRKRYRHLSHLPLTTSFQLCEVDLNYVLPSSAFSCVIEELESRAKRRHRRLKQEQVQKANEESVSVASVSRVKIPLPSEFMGIMNATNEEEVLQSDAEESIHDSPGAMLSPPLDERRRFSHVTKLGFASAHDAPALCQQTGNEETSCQLQCATLASGVHLQNGSTDERVSRTSVMSFADVIQAQPPKLIDSDSSGNSAAARNSSRKGRKNSKVLLSTAGGRRY